ncbi:MAG TPA: aminotransferase class V-fold PLP-dependent enzyme [Candidatus Faecicola pullistercoris]|nr:aminotransferase class V-fold PLP-dependent enzyme [Candidatus Faecicola pullistercoris]
MIYFDNAATSRFKPKKSRRALLETYVNSANGGRGGHDDAVNAAVKTETARSILLENLGAAEGYDLIFTKNCTEALNLAVFGTVKKGGHVITTVTEHNSVLRPLYELQRNKIITLSVINPDKNLTVRADMIERLITEETYMLAVSSMSNVTGVPSEISKTGKLARKYNLVYLADGAQSVPHVRTDMREQNIDLLACPGHKGLHGPQGTGFLIVRQGIALKPLLYGGTGTNSDSVYQPLTLPEGMESGTLNTAGIAALGEAAKWTFEHINKINARISLISNKILYGLKKMPGIRVYTPDGCHTGVISFNLNGLTSSEVGDILNEKYKIAVRTGLHCAPLMHNYLGTLESGAVRISVGYNNTLKDADLLLKAIGEIADTYKKEDNL